MANYSNNRDMPLQEYQPAIALLQSNSPQLIRGNKAFVANAMAGTYLVPVGDGGIVLESLDFLLLRFVLNHPEFQKGGIGGPIHDYGVDKPRDADFHYAHEGYPRSGHYLPSGNEVVPTITAYMLAMIEGRLYPNIFRFTHSAHTIGKNLYFRTEKLKAAVDGKEERGCAVGKYRLTATLRTDGGRSWFQPVCTVLGKVGEDRGPALEQARCAIGVREALLAGADWASLELPAPAATPSLPKPESDGPPEPPPRDTYDGPDDDDGYEDAAE
jgi:hypothetical protein